MKIGMLLHKQFPPDPRVEQEIRTLQAEHELFVLASRRGDQPEQEIWRDIHIERIFSAPRRRWESFNLQVRCRSAGWRNAIRRFVLLNEIQVLHVHDLPLLGSAINVGAEYGILVVADLHENFPELIAQQQNSLHRWSLQQKFFRYLVSIERWRQYETEVVPKADAVIVVIEESKERIVSLGVPSDRVHVVANYAPLDELEEIAATKEYRPQEENQFRVIYGGGFGSSRDLHTVIDAAAGLQREIDQLKVILVGGLEQEVKMLTEYADQAGVADRVEVLGRHPFREFISLLASCDVGLVPHVKSAHTDTTIPHKLFQYMALKRPAIVSDCDPLVRIVSESGAGLVYTAGDASELAKAISQLYYDRVLREIMGCRGHQAVKNKYNWQETSKVLKNTYSNFSDLRQS